MSLTATAKAGRFIPLMLAMLHAFIHRTWNIFGYIRNDGAISAATSCTVLILVTSCRPKTMMDGTISC